MQSLVIDLLLLIVVIMINYGKASIIVLTYKNADYARMCLESILTQTTYPDFEVVVVDNASPQEMRESLQEFTDQDQRARLILNEKNEGFARGNNIGLEAATGDYYVLLNDDVVVTSGWLSTLVSHLQDPSVGMVGPVTNSSGNETRIQVDYQNVEAMEQFAEKYTRSHAGETFEIDMLPFHCVALRREVFEQVGPLDERFGRGMFEDDDYALRLKGEGYRLICAEDVFVHHWGSASFSRLGVSEYWHLFDSNRKKFEEKWGVPWQPHHYRAELLNEQIRQMVDGSSWLASLVTEGNNKILRLEAQLAERDQTLNEIHSSRAWTLVTSYWNMRSILAPQGSTRDKLLVSLFRLFGLVLESSHQGIRALKKFLKRYPFLAGLNWYAYAFRRFRKARHRYYTDDFKAVRCPSRKGFVSIVLPVYNGTDYLRESLESILGQTYPHFEVIAVDDGSTDETPQILKEFAQHDERIRVVRQNNQKLPRALNRGFDMANGEYLTWTSADNRMKTDFLERMVSCLQRHPDWDMVYANQDIIGEDGNILVDSDWFSGYQEPSGSGHVFLPTDPSELNMWPNNYVGGAFLYRDRVDHLIGEYSTRRFGTEDYDYWMRVNGLLNLRHADFKQPVYDYRFHDDSLTSRDDELGITRNRVKLMTFEDFRRDFYLSPLYWKIEHSGEPQAARWAEKIREKASVAGHVFHKDSGYEPRCARRLWFPAVYLRIVVNDLSVLDEPVEELPGALKVILVTGDRSLPDKVDETWDLCVTTSAVTELVNLAHPRQGWLGVSDDETLFSTLDVRCRSDHLAAIETEIENPSPSEVKISVVICTYHRGGRLFQTIESVARQSLSIDDSEVIVVNNDPKDLFVQEIVDSCRQTYFEDCPEKLRLISSPFEGLSFARNAGISEAKGEIVSFVDDDAIADFDWLEQIWQAAEAYPNAGVIGGKILLDIPNPRPMWVKPGWEKFWSQYIPDFETTRPVKHWWEFPWGANWSARRKALLQIGGFRSNYGRRGADFGGGEELVAASLIAHLGFEIVIEPNCTVIHRPDEKRFSLDHVKRTIIAGKFNEYREQLDLYLPMNLRLPTFLKGIFRNLVGLASIKSKSAHLRGEQVLYLRANIRLLWRYLSDRWNRHRFGLEKDF
jgi:GT2 family glycosyltransferase